MWVSFLLGLLAFSSLTARLNQNGDFQVWLHDGVSAHFNSHYGVDISQEFRFGNDCTEFYQQYSQIFLVYYGSPSFQIAPGFKQLYSKGEGKAWYSFSIPELDIKMILQNKFWRFEHRERISYAFSAFKGTWIFRPFFNLDTPFYYKNRALKLFLSEEFFWTQGQGINQNRFKVGFKLPGGKHVLFSLAYLIRNLKERHDWTYQNVLDLSVDFNF